MKQPQQHWGVQVHKIKKHVVSSGKQTPSIFKHAYHGNTEIPPSADDNKMKKVH